MILLIQFMFYPTPLLGKVKEIRMMNANDTVMDQTQIKHTDLISDWHYNKCVSRAQVHLTAVICLFSNDDIIQDYNALETIIKEFGPIKVCRPNMIQSVNASTLNPYHLLSCLIFILSSDLETFLISNYFAFLYQILIFPSSEETNKDT